MSPNETQTRQPNYTKPFKFFQPTHNLKEIVRRCFKSKGGLIQRCQHGCLPRPGWCPWNWLVMIVILRLHGGVLLPQFNTVWPSIRLCGVLQWLNFSMLSIIGKRHGGGTMMMSDAVFVRVSCLESQPPFKVIFASVDFVTLLPCYIHYSHYLI